MADAEATAAAVPRGASYDRIAQAVHWLVAALAVTVIWLGWGIAWTPRNTRRRDLFVLIHESVGLSIFAAMVFRGWWRWRHPPHHCHRLSPVSKPVWPGSPIFACMYS